ncbi:hypothetical protein GH714_039707 [Hevea brasiliensis]|uniref:non-specific serine/threonine protein kinase n=1 Tax=Hevea brasiliensis TaxID=3981 RepID=A0A6A6MZX3_HEVBR|nr:hypothetical protein GH714_039707 [Hevea brasiliensis]
MDTPPPPKQQKQSSSTELDFDNLRAIKVLGKGAMGTVFLVHDRVADPCARTPYALKVVEKSTLHMKFEADRRARWEIQVLTKLSGRNSHPFLPHLISSLETQDFLAWAVPFCSGGDLNVLRYRQHDRVFSPAVVRFYLAEIVCALEHLHEMGIVYRDLKPENILIQQSGHVTLTDFDLSRTLRKRTVKTILSSADHHHFDQPANPQSLALSLDTQKKHRHRHPIPHRFDRRNLTRWLPTLPSNDKTGLKKTKSARVSPRGWTRIPVDWWALGILTYEMSYGTTPFKGKNRKETFRNILSKKPEFVGKRNELTDLIERLLEKDPTKRLGYQRGACEIKEHVFFKGLRWDLLTEVLRPPFIPARDDTNLTETTEGVDIREYFQNLKAPPSLPPSRLPSPSSECHRSMSLKEF